MIPFNWDPKSLFTLKVTVPNFLRKIQSKVKHQNSSQINWQKKFFLQLQKLSNDTVTLLEAQFPLTET